jgi:hypothetical protein
MHLHQQQHLCLLECHIIYLECCLCLRYTDRVKQIYDTYANENTYFDRIALVGCNTSRIKQGLTRDFAKMIYDNIPALKT